MSPKHRKNLSAMFSTTVNDGLEEEEEEYEEEEDEYSDDSIMTTTAETDTTDKNPLEQIERRIQKRFGSMLYHLKLIKFKIKMICGNQVPCINQ